MLLKFIRGIYNLPDKLQACVATIGNFDGVHLGHQALLHALTTKAKALNLPSLVITFEPQPNEYFANAHIPARLMRLREKIRVLQTLNIDYVLCLRFDPHLAHLSAKDFVEKILVNALGVRYLIVGDDFHFGYQRQGDIALLANLGMQYGFTAASFPAFIIDGKRVSSTAIRHALEQGDLKTAQAWLGQAFGMCGRVAQGDKRGRIIGFPTANIHLHRKAVPIQGVFAVKVYGLSDKTWYGVANVGKRPTFDGTRNLLEVHLFDFNQKIYGKLLYVEFIHKLRDEKRFDSFEKLKQQIILDAEQAKHYFSQHSS